MTVPERIAELEQEVAHIRHAMTVEDDSEMRNLQAKLIVTLLTRIRELKKLRG